MKTIQGLAKKLSAPNLRAAQGPVTHYRASEFLVYALGMNTFTALSHSALLQATRKLVQEERRITALVLAHLEEIERRRLHLENHSSLFDFCRRALGYSENEANSRISAMRLSREVPEVIAKVESGELSLTNLVKAQSFFRQEARAGQSASVMEKRELLTMLEGKSTRDCERIIADRSPAMRPMERARAISSTLTEITFAADPKLMVDLDRLRAIWGHLGHLTYAELIQKMAELALKKLDPEPKIHKPATQAIQSPGAPQVLTPNASDELNPPPEFVTPTTRHIAASTRREIWHRDGGHCAHLYPATGKRCASTFALEIDHVIPYAYGGSHEAANLRILCRAHHSLKSARERDSA